MSVQRADFQQVSRADRHERILDVVGSRRNAHTSGEKLVQAREASRRQLLGAATLQKKIGSGQRNHGDIRLG